MSLVKRSRRNRSPRRSGEVELNLIPLIDIMSVMVAFLLVYSANVEVIQNSQGVQIPQSIAQEQPKQSVVVMITKDHLFVQGEPVVSIADVLVLIGRKAAGIRPLPRNPALRRPAWRGRPQRRPAKW